MRKTMLCLLLMVFLSGALVHPQEEQFPVFEGPYFGQAPPAAVPGVL